MQGVEQLLDRLKTHQEMLLYNKKLVDPYQLAAHGLVISNKHRQDGNNQPVAICNNNNCNLIIEFDSLNGEEEAKDQLQMAITDHDVECPFGQHTPLKLNCALFRDIGLQLYQQRIQNIQLHQKFIQLSPKEVKMALGLQETPQKSYQLNISLEMFRKLDKRLSGERLTKVKSSIFLALFGWEFSESSQNEMQCRFCAISRNVFEFLSPSECTLMSLPTGFDFISAHRPWCCLIKPSLPLWKQVLKQVVLRGLEGKEGQVSRNQAEMHCREVQDKAARIYANGYSQWTAQKKQLDEFKSTIQSNYPMTSQKDNEIKSCFFQRISHLQATFEACRQSVQKFVKRIKIT